MKITNISVKFDDKTIDDFATCIKVKNWDEIPEKLEQFKKDYENEGIEKIIGVDISL